MTKEKVFLSDNDGTLTTARKKITGEMADTLIEFADHFKFCITTGSPYSDMVEQMPEAMLNHPNVEFWCCLGNVLYKGGVEVHNSNASIDFDLFKNELEYVIENCPVQFHKSHPRKHESEGSRINFTMLGRPEIGEPSLEDRNEYLEWDLKHGQRDWVIKHLTEKFPDYNMTLGGQISVDIVKKGFDKAQVATRYKDCDISYFGDRIYTSGNDNSVAHEIVDMGGTIYSVKNPADTMRIMKNLIRNRKEGTF